jgi:DNA polymerase-3 subunit chi
MTQVDFYITDDQGSDARARLACRIVEKAYKLQRKVYVVTPGPEQATQLDELLWLFRAGSFIPHRRIDQPDEDDCPVIIGWEDSEAVAPDVLVNLSDAVPAFFSRFERVAEVVSAVPEVRDQARERFRFYRERGYPLETHELSG